MVEGVQVCKASNDFLDPSDPVMCQCSHVKEAQMGTGNVQTNTQFV